MPDIAFVNGEFCDIHAARVSIEDRGFQFADGVYEVLVAVDGRPFRMAQHLERLKRSTDSVNIQVDYARLGLPGIIQKGLERCGYHDALIYIQITRGVAPRDHIYPPNLTPTVVATFKPKPVLKPELRSQGVALQTVEDIRWAHCAIKSVALLANVLLKNAARQAGYHDALIVGGDRSVRETTCANIFMIAGGTVLTPPATDSILHGVTRAYVLECAEQLGLPSLERDFTVRDLQRADEAFISSTTADILPVSAIDGSEIGARCPGPITTQLLEQFYKGQRSA